MLEAMIENENTEEEIEQWTDKHRAAVAIYDTPIEEIKNRFVTLKREKEAYDAEQEERRIQRRLEEERRILEIQNDAKQEERRIQKKLEEERRILEIQTEMKEKEEREKEEEKKEDSLVNYCKFSKTKYWKNSRVFRKITMQCTSIRYNGKNKRDEWVCESYTE